jgi:predicted RNA polymerase sigma factor
VPEDPEAAGLLALMLLTDARRPARSGPGSELIPLAEQDRGRWDTGLIAEGAALITWALGRGHAGEYQVQAAIAALHDQAASCAATDWPQILTLYDLLAAMTANPMVTLNRAVAAAMAHGPGAGLALLDGLDERLGDHHRFHSVRAHLLEQAGDHKAAIAEFRAAAARTTNLREQHYLTQAGRVAAASASGAPPLRASREPAAPGRHARISSPTGAPTGRGPGRRC